MRKRIREIFVVMNINWNKHEKNISHLRTVVLHVIQLTLLLSAAGRWWWQSSGGMNETVGTVGADLEMMLQLMMEVPLVIAALAARVVVLHVRVTQGRAVTLVIRMRAGNRDRRRKLVHARGLLVIHHLLLLLLLLNGTRGWLLLRLLPGLPLRLVAAFAAGVS